MNFNTAFKLDPILKITPYIIRILGFNPGLMTLQGTNTYIVGNGPTRILLDTGEYNKPEYIDALKKIIDSEKIQLGHIILTHWHIDHTGGLKDVYEKFGEGSKVWKFRRSDNPNPSRIDDIPINYLKNFQEIQVNGATLRVIHTPGHTTDHIVLHLKEDNSLFTGDCILGCGTSVFEDLFEYMKSLDVILNLKPKTLYPGHGPVVEDARERIESYINHRKTREQQILNELVKYKGQSITASNLVKAIYSDVRDTLYTAAELNVVNHLKKLKKEGKVSELSGKWTML